MWHRLRRKTCYFLPKTCDLRPRLVGGGRGLEQPRPLAIGIGKLIQVELASSLPSWAISAAIGAHTRSHGYLKALADGTTRIGLDGEPAGTVAETERQHAIEQLDVKCPGWRK
jgi:hypothetical protein